MVAAVDVNIVQHSLEAVGARSLGDTGGDTRVPEDSNDDDWRVQRVSMRLSCSF